MAEQHTTGSHTESPGDPHIHSDAIYYKVFGALIALTFLTVGISEVDLGGSLNIILGLMIAVIKGTTVAWFFMHLNQETGDKMIFTAVYFPIFLVLLIVSLVLTEFVWLVGVPTWVGGL